MNKQPEALRLADECQGIGESDDWPQLLDAASELRRLHAENQALNDALQYSIGCHLEMSELAVRQRARLDELEPQVEREPFTVLVRKHSWLANQWEAAPRGFPDYGRSWADERVNVYTHQQPKREPLTDEKIKQLDFDSCSSLSFAENQIAFARAIEAAHNIK